MNPFHSWLGPVPRSIGIALIAVIAWSSEIPAAEETTRLDCGVDALYILLRLEGRAVTYEHLLATLPVPHPDGHSMAELRDAAARLGLGLEGRQLGGRIDGLDQPMIAFFQSPKKGHFAVLRPVGSTGKMAQVIDPPHAPWIGDFDQLASKKVWTGRVLIPRKPWISRISTQLAIGLVTMATFMFTYQRYRHRRAILDPTP